MKTKKILRSSEGPDNTQVIPIHSTEPIAPIPTNMFVSDQTIKDMAEHKERLNGFISSQLKEGNDGSGDYGRISGYEKKILWKPGAEKLLRLFGLAVKIEMTDKIFDIDGNFALFTYKAIISHLGSGAVIAECEGCANSQEKKYLEVKTWYEEKAKNSDKMISKTKKAPAKVGDILNTLMKMAQKRAMVGATILAVSGSDYLSQDLDDEVVEQEKKRKREESANKDHIQVEAPICCDKKMMVSKYVDRKNFGEIEPWYCLQCGGKQARD